MAGRITIERASRGWFASARAYRVLLDGNRVARVRWGQSVTVAAAPGRHELQLALDWMRSPKLELEVVDGGQDLRILCGPYDNPLVSLFRAVFTPRRFIVVEFDPRWRGA